MRIIFVSYHYWPSNFGGELLISIERFESLVNRGHFVDVYTSGFPGQSKKEIKNSIEVFRSPLVHDSKIGRGFRRLLFPIWVAIKLMNQKFDILHLGGVGGIGPISSNLSNFLISIVTKIKKGKIVWVHSLADTENKYFSNENVNYKLRNFFLKFVDIIVSVSPSLYESVLEYFPKKSKLIVCGIRDDVFSKLSKDERKKFRIENNILETDIVFSFLGTIGKRKGFDILADAFIGLESKFPNWKLWIVGPKSHKENQNVDNHEIVKLINPLEEFSETIKFWGRVDDRNKLAKILGSSDIFVFPSRKEGMGIAPMEAMATGVPVIVSRIPGVTDLANIQEQTGLYFELEDLDGLKEAMVKLGTNEELRLDMGKKAHYRVKNVFNWTKHIKDWEDLYLNLIKIS